MFKENFESIHDVYYKNTKDSNLIKRTKNQKKLSWLYFTYGWSNEKHCDMIYVGDIFDHSEFLKQVKLALEETKSFKKFAPKLEAAVWSCFYGKSEYESTITKWPFTIDSGEAVKLFEKVLTGSTMVHANILNSTKVSVGECIFLNWTPFAEYVWTNRQIVKKMKGN